MTETHTCTSPDATFRLGEQLGKRLGAGDVLLLSGGLGAGKTLLTKGIMSALSFDADDVTSPSFTLVNRYKTAKFDVYHIDLWRLEAHPDAGAAVGLDEIVENRDAVVVIEWPDRLGTVPRNAITILIKGDGDQPRKIEVKAAG